MRAILTVAAGVLALSACTKADWGIPPSAEELAALDTAKCADYGYPTEHPDHGLCRMLLDQQRATAASAQRAAVAGNPGMAIAGASLLQQALSPPAPAPIIPSSQVTCFPAGGGYITCR